MKNEAKKTYVPRADKNGRVKYALKTGKDLSGGTLPLNAVERIIQDGKVTESDIPDYAICVDGEWYFDGKEVKK